MNDTKVRYETPVFARNFGECIDTYDDKDVAIFCYRRMLKELQKQRSKRQLVMVFIPGNSIKSKNSWEIYLLYEGVHTNGPKSVS